MLCRDDVFRKIRLSAAACLLSASFFLSVGCSTATSTTDIDGERRDPLESAETEKISFPKPASHEAGWSEYHGNTADLIWNAPGQKGNACFTCHMKNDCVECHNTRLPRDHRNMWRTRTHGFTASLNRNRCSVCCRGWSAGSSARGSTAGAPTMWPGW